MKKRKDENDIVKHPPGNRISLQLFRFTGGCFH